jgi:hypothetical protein
MNIKPIAATWLAFGGHASEIADRNMGAILQALDEAEQHQDGPTVKCTFGVSGQPEVLVESFGLMPQNIPKAAPQVVPCKSS